MFRSLLSPSHARICSGTFARGLSVLQHARCAPAVLQNAFLGVPHAWERACSTQPATADAPAMFQPLYSRAARRLRLQAALEVSARGGEFVLPAPGPQAMPGPCGAVMTVLTEHGPMTTSNMFDAITKRFPGVMKSKTHLKQAILKRALVNKLMKVAHSGTPSPTLSQMSPRPRPNHVPIPCRVSRFPTRHSNEHPS